MFFLLLSFIINHNLTPMLKYSLTENVLASNPNGCVAVVSGEYLFAYLMACERMLLYFHFYRAVIPTGFFLNVLHFTFNLISTLFNLT